MADESQIVATEPTRREAVAAAVELLTTEAAETGESCSIMICLDVAMPCPFQTVRYQPCPMCERVTVHPGGHVETERKNG